VTGTSARTRRAGEPGSAAPAYEPSRSRCSAWSHATSRGVRNDDDRDEAGLGRTVRGLKVSAAGLPDLVERLVRRWLDQRGAGETFSTWAHRVDEEQLR